VDEKPVSGAVVIAGNEVASPAVRWAWRPLSLRGA